MIRKIYFSPTCGRSHDLPPNITPFLLEEECNYRMSCTQRQLDGFDSDVPPDVIESFERGVEKTAEKIKTIYGDDEVVYSWDAPGIRYYLEFNDLEEALDDLMLGTGLRVILDCRDREDKFQGEFCEIIYGFPEIGTNDRTAEIETDHVPQQIESIEDEY